VTYVSATKERKKVRWLWFHFINQLLCNFCVATNTRKLEEGEVALASSISFLVTLVFLQQISGNSSQVLEQKIKKASHCSAGSKSPTGSISCKD
jgi:hypothetical protein